MRRALQARSMAYRRRDRGAGKARMVMLETVTIDIQSDQTLTVVKAPDGAVTLRVAKAGHNRAVAKLTVDQRALVAEFLS